MPHLKYYQRFCGLYRLYDLVLLTIMITKTNTAFTRRVFVNEESMGIAATVGAHVGVVVVFPTDFKFSSVYKQIVMFPRFVRLLILMMNSYMRKPHECRILGGLLWVSVFIGFLIFDGRVLFERGQTLLQT